MESIFASLDILSLEFGSGRLGLGRPDVSCHCRGNNRQVNYVGVALRGEKECTLKVLSVLVRVCTVDACFIKAHF